MTKEINYVGCQSCAWRIQQKGYDPETEWCKRCKNTRQVRDPREILCNMCGECMCPLGTMNEQYPHGLFEAKVTGGYDSYHLFDLSQYVFSFCEKCLRQLFVQCKIKPLILDVNIGGGILGEDNWEHDRSSYEYRLWKDGGGAHLAYLNGKCNVVTNCPNEAVYTHLVSGDFTEDACCEEHKDERLYGNTKLTKFIPNVLKPFL